MTREDQFIEGLQGYLDDYEGQTPLPGVVRDAIRAQLPTTRQVSSRSGPIGRLSMSLALPTPARYGLLAAVVVAAAAALGVAFLNGVDNVGDDSSPSPATTGSQATLIEPVSGGIFTDLAAGTYYIDDPFPVRVTFDLPTQGSVFHYTPEGTQANVRLQTAGEVSFEVIDNVSAEPCTGELLDPPPGPSVDDLVTAISNLPGFGATPAIDVTVDGFFGKRFTLTAPSNGDAPCGSMFTWRTTTRQNGVGPDEVNEVTILDVDGVRLLIATADVPGISQAGRLALREVVDSVQLGP